MIKEEQLAAYKEMAKNASANGMEAQIRENLERTCEKFAATRTSSSAAFLIWKNAPMKFSKARTETCPTRYASASAAFFSIAQALT